MYNLPLLGIKSILDLRLPPYNKERMLVHPLGLWGRGGSWLVVLRFVVLFPVSTIVCHCIASMMPYYRFCDRLRAGAGAKRPPALLYYLLVRTILIREVVKIRTKILGRFEIGFPVRL